MEQSIKISNVNKKYGNKEILKDVSFEAQKGRITAFLGPNGAGKSTTLRILLGLDSADSGTEIYVRTVGRCRQRRRMSWQ